MNNMTNDFESSTGRYITRQEMSKNDILQMEKWKSYDLFNKSIYTGVPFSNFTYRVHPVEYKLMRRIVEFDKFKNVRIDEKLIKLLMFTENMLFKRKLFYPAFFIDSDFKFDDRFIVKGILVFECFTIKREGKTVHVKFTESGESEGIADVRVNFVVIDKKINDVTLFNVSFNELDFNIKVFGDEVWVNYIKNFVISEYRLEKETIAEVLKGVFRIVCNVVDLVEGNKDELELKLISPSQSQNEKRIKKGKSPVTTTVVIRPKNQLLSYTEAFEREHHMMKYSHRFVVRGFWRHYKSDYYKDMQGKKVWVKPFLKGKGILIKKDALFTD